MRYSFMIVTVAVLLSAAAWLKERDSETSALSQSVGTFSESQTEAVPHVLPKASPEAVPHVLPKASPEAVFNVLPEASPEAVFNVLPEASPEVLPETLSTQEPKPALLPEGAARTREAGEITLIGGDFLQEESTDLSVTSCSLRSGLSIEDALCRQDTDALYAPEQIRP